MIARVSVAAFLTLCFAILGLQSPQAQFNGCSPGFCTPTVAAAQVASNWNPSDKSANITLSNANLTAAGTNTSDGAVRNTTSHNASKLYFEVLLGGTVAGGDTGVGIATGAATLSTIASSATGAAIIYVINPGVWFNGSFSASTGFTSFAAGDVVRVAVDFGNSKAWFDKNGAGSWYGSSNPGNPATNSQGMNISTLFPTNAAFAAFTANSATPTGTLRTISSQFTFTVPSGFSAWQ